MREQPCSEPLPIRRTDRKDWGAPRMFVTQQRHEALLALNAAVAEMHKAKVGVEQALEVMSEAIAMRDQAHEKMMHAQIMVEVTQ